MCPTGLSTVRRHIQRHHCINLARMNLRSVCAHHLPSVERVQDGPAASKRVEVGCYHLLRLKVESVAACWSCHLVEVGGVTLCLGHGLGQSCTSARVRRVDDGTAVMREWRASNFLVEALRGQQACMHTMFDHAAGRCTHLRGWACWRHCSEEPYPSPPQIVSENVDNVRPRRRQSAGASAG